MAERWGGLAPVARSARKRFRPSGRASGFSDVAGRRNPAKRSDTRGGETETWTRPTRVERVERGERDGDEGGTCSPFAFPHNGHKGGVPCAGSGGRVTSPRRPSSPTPVCRICREPAGERRLLKPCSCRGSVGHVHESCLRTWLQVRYPPADLLTSSALQPKTANSNSGESSSSIVGGDALDNVSGTRHSSPPFVPLSFPGFPDFSPRYSRSSFDAATSSRTTGGTSVAAGDGGDEIAARGHDHGRCGNENGDEEIMADAGEFVVPGRGANHYANFSPAAMGGVSDTPHSQAGGVAGRSAHASARVPRCEICLDSYELSVRPVGWIEFFAAEAQRTLVRWRARSWAQIMRRCWRYVLRHRCRLLLYAFHVAYFAFLAATVRRFYTSIAAATAARARSAGSAAKAAASAAAATAATASKLSAFPAGMLSPQHEALYRRWSASAAAAAAAAASSSSSPSPSSLSSSSSSSFPSRPSSSWGSTRTTLRTRRGTRFSPETESLAPIMSSAETLLMATGAVSPHVLSGAGSRARLNFAARVLCLLVMSCQYSTMLAKGAISVFRTLRAQKARRARINVVEKIKRTAASPASSAEVQK